MMGDICRQMGILFPDYAAFLFYVSEQIETNTYLSYSQAKWESKVECGLMSGFKTTSIFGSLINLCICRAVLRSLAYEPEFLAVLGDDIDIGFAKTINPAKIYAAYE